MAVPKYVNQLNVILLSHYMSNIIQTKKKKILYCYQVQKNSISFVCVFVSQKKKKRMGNCLILLKKVCCV